MPAVLLRACAGQNMLCEVGLAEAVGCVRHGRGTALVRGLGCRVRHPHPRAGGIGRADPERGRLELAALVGCALSTGVGAVFRTARVTPGSSVAVVGCGGVGLCVIQGAKMAGASKIVAVDRVASKLELAAHSVRPTSWTRPPAIPSKAVKAATGGRGADFTFEVVGISETIKQSFAVTRRGGTAVLVGAGSAADEVTFNALELFLDAKTLMGCVYGSTDADRDFPVLVDMIGRGAIDARATRHEADRARRHKRCARLDGGGRGSEEPGGVRMSGAEAGEKRPGRAAAPDGTAPPERRAPWRYLDLGAIDAFESNAQLPVVVRDVAATGRVAVTTSVWGRTHLNVGWFDDVDETVDLEAAARKGVQVIRRPFYGGGTAFYGEGCAATWAFLLPKVPAGADAAAGRASHSTTGSQGTSRWCSTSWRRLGLSEVQFEGSSDLRINGRKLGALTAQDIVACDCVGGFINLSKPDLDLYLSIARVPDEKFKDKVVKDLREYVITAEEIAGHPVGYEDFRDAVLGALDSAGIAYEARTVHRRRASTAQSWCGQGRLRRLGQADLDRAVPRFCARWLTTRVRQLQGPKALPCRSGLRREAGRSSRPCSPVTCT